MKASELRQKNMTELRNLLIEQSKERFKLLMQKGLGETPKPQILRNVCLNIARINTILNEKERQA